MADHTHQLANCHDCDGGVYSWDRWHVCETCNGRGYLEVCWICGEPMGNRRRRWKRDQSEPVRTHPPSTQHMC